MALDLDLGLTQLNKLLLHLLKNQLIKQHITQRLFLFLALVIA
jgi:hypothetical protein